MKRIILTVLSICLIFTFAACADDEKLAERSIDGVAAYLGYTDGEEITDLDGMMFGPGAIAGKYFKDGQVSIYEFDPDSDEYKDVLTQTDCCAGGFVIIYDYDSYEGLTDYEILERIEEIEDIKFETE